MKSTCKITETGAKIWLNKYGKIHREDGPAIEYTDGTICWYIDNCWIHPVKAIDDPIIQSKYPELIAAIAVYLVYNS